MSHAASARSFLTRKNVPQALAEDPATVLRLICPSFPNSCYRSRLGFWSWACEGVVADWFSRRL